MQGVYTFSRTLPKHFTPEKYPATGTIRWTIWEWRKGSNSYEKVQTFTPPSQRDRLGWWTYSNTRIELDGAVKIIAEVLESGKRVGVQHVRLNHVDVLPEHLELAKDMCVDGDERLWRLFWDIVTLVGTAAAFVITSVATAGASVPVLVATISKVVASTGTTLTTQAIRGLAAEVSEQAEERKASKLNECRDFHATFWWDGYSKFSDDIAELSNSEEEYETFGCTYLPARRSPTSKGTASCKQPSVPTPTPEPAPVPTPTSQPAAKEVQISWGSDASGRSDCPQGQRCLYLGYQYIGDWGSPPYTLECWGNGRKAWEGQWSGRATRGCIAWAGTTHVVVDGIRSNTLTHPNS